MFAFIFGAIKIIFLLGFVVFIHEGGHFVAAKISGVKVNEFAIGFGPTLFRKKYKETIYKINILPLGGYVDLEGETKKSDDLRSFKNATFFKRVCILLSGGLVNIIFALILYFILISTTGNYVTNKVDYVSSELVSSDIGIVENDEIIKINSKSIHTINDINDVMKDSKGDSLVVSIKRNEEKINLEITPIEINTKNIGIYFDNKKDENSTKILLVEKNGPSEKVGLKLKDKIIKINDVHVEDNVKLFIETISHIKEDSINLLVNRDGTEIVFNVIPRTVTSYKLGVVLKQGSDIANILETVKYSFYSTGDFFASMIDNVKTLFSGNAQIDSFTGPIGIGETIANTKELYSFCYLLALISLSLGVMNLLPIIPLDGGKILIQIIEKISKKEVPEKIEVWLSILGFVILVGLSLVIAYNDIIRLL